MDLIEKIGPYAGLIGFIGTTILAFLYFSQARDVRRLREWAGRGPERAAQAEARQAAAGESPPAVPSGPAVAETAAGGAAETAETTAPETEETGVAPPPKPEPPKPMSLDQVQRRREEARRRWRWLSEPRYVALVVGGLLILGAAAIAAVVMLTSGNSSTRSSSERAREKGKTAQIQPSEVTVAVLNGTGIPGLANQVGEDLKAVGFQVKTVTNASQGGIKRTAVLYTRGHKLKAQAVAKQLRTGSPRPADPQNATLGARAEVIVTVGSDKAPAGSRSSSQTGGASSGSQSGGSATPQGGGTSSGGATPTPQGTPVPPPQ